MNICMKFKYTMIWHKNRRDVFLRNVPLLQREAVKQIRPINFLTSAACRTWPLLRELISSNWPMTHNLTLTLDNPNPNHPLKNVKNLSAKQNKNYVIFIYGWLVWQTYLPIILMRQYHMKYLYLYQPIWTYRVYR